MFLMLSGVVVLGLTVAVFIALMPRGGKLHRFADTEWEPYVSVAICSGTALGLTMTLSGVLNLLGNQ